MGRVLLVNIVAACAIFAAAPAFAAPAATAGLRAEVTPASAGLATKLSDGAHRVSRVLGHPVAFDAPNARSQMAPVFAGAVDRTTRAFEDSVVILNGRERTISIKRVLFVEGDKPEAKLQGDVLRITVAARLDLSGPAHEQIFHLLVTQATA